MLRQRVLTGVIGGLVALSLILFAPLWVLAAVAVVLILAAAWEWGALTGIPGVLWRILWLLGVAALSLLSLVMLQRGQPALPAIWLGAALLWWIGVVAWLLAGARPRAGLQGLRTGWLPVGLLLLPGAAIAMVWLAMLPEGGRWLLLYAVTLVWIADTGAYFVGRAYGRRALAPSISAGKTREGLAGGLGAVAVYAVVTGILVDSGPIVYASWLALALGAACISVAGDLFISVLKREAGVKDSGHLLPGHGGVLDRIDSQLAALPALALGLGTLAGAGT